jgi:phosphate/sulfate permease
MIILIAIIPFRFALDHSKRPEPLRDHIAVMQTMLIQIDTTQMNNKERAEIKNINLMADSLSQNLSGIVSFADLSKKTSLNARRDILLIAKKSQSLLAGITGKPLPSVSNQWIKDYKVQVNGIRSYTEYAPWWVILSIALSLGLGTMVGWKRIVVTIGEKIGKTHMTYAQGATAEIIAASTISVSSLLGMPVSTTHVLSSGIAGSMVAGSGFKNLQRKTVAAIGIAWLITLPVTILFSGMLFLLFRLIFV